MVLLSCPSASSCLEEADLPWVGAVNTSLQQPLQLLGARVLCDCGNSLSVIGTIYWCDGNVQEVWVGLQHFRPILEAPWEGFPFYTDGKKKMNVFWQEHHVFSVLPFKCSNDTGWAWGEVVRLSLLLFQLKWDNSGLQSSCEWWEWVEEVLAGWEAALSS